MSQSLSRIVLHLVFSTKNREPWLDSDLRPRVFAYLADIGRDMGCEVYRVGGTVDHVHMAVLLARTLRVADFMKKVKGSSSVWIKEHGENHAGFSWQAGYGTFSLGVSQLQALTGYIDRQEEHHRVKGFQDEYREMLRKYGVEFDERYVWD
jgi:putative transposase